MGVSIVLSLLFTALVINSQLTFASEEAKPLDEAIDNLTHQIVRNIMSEKKQKIAVVDFLDLYGKRAIFGKYLSEELITRLFRTGMFEVMERQLLQKVLSEQGVTLTGYLHPDTVKQIGRVLGVNAIVSGTITDLGMSLRVNARIISTETGEVSSAAFTSIAKDERVMRILGRKIPGLLEINAAKIDYAKVFLDGTFRETVIDDKATIRHIPPGTHSLKIEKEGFKEFKKQIVIGEAQVKTLKVKGIIRGSNIPLRSCLYSAIIPGVGAPKSMVTKYSAYMFYLFAAAYIIVPMTTPPDSIDPGWAPTVLTLMGMSYLTNVVSSYIWGRNYYNAYKSEFQEIIELGMSETGWNLFYALPHNRGIGFGIKFTRQL